MTNIANRVTLIVDYIVPCMLLARARIIDSSRLDYSVTNNANAVTRIVASVFDFDTMYPC